MNVIPSALFLLLSVILGHIFSSKYLLKYKFYDDFYQFNEKVINEVLYFQKTLNSIINCLPESDFSRVIKSYFEKKKIAQVDFLTAEENEYLNNYLINVGKSDRDTQIEYLQRVRLNIDSIKKGAETSLKKYRPLYLKISLLIGLIAFVVLL